MTDLTTFARRLMRLTEKSTQNNTARAIFGSIGDLPQSIAARPPYRIGLWPCASEEKPEYAMGLWVLLAHLLERWQDVLVYRLFVKLAGEPENFEWSIRQSQFDVDDWPVDPLDENIGMWGTLKQVDDKWELKVSIENDLLTGQDNETTELLFTGETTSKILEQLPAIAEKIASTIEAERLVETEPLYNNSDLPDEKALQPLFSKLIEWDAKLLATLWGAEFEDEDAEEVFEDLLEIGKHVNHDIAAWIVSKAIAHTMLPGYSVIGDLFIDRVNEVTDAFSKSDLPAPLLAWSIYRMGDVPEAYKLLENNIKTHPKSIIGWLRLGELYAIGGRLEEAIDRFQTAIEKGLTNNYIYRSYGNVLLAADQYGVLVEEVILVDIDEVEEEEDIVLYEAIEAYDEALKLSPNDARALYNQLTQMLYVEYDEDDIWSTFKKLLELDTNGDYVRDVIDSMYDIEDIQPGIEAVEAVIKTKGERIDLYINLASLHLSQENGDEAKPYLEKAKNLTQSIDKLADIERLLLTADDANFEQRFGEVDGVVSAGNSLSPDDVEFLEEATENAPHFITAHLMLASAYHNWDDKDAALEVLLDVQEKIPDNPAVLDMLARILWEADEKQLAFEYLNKGLIAYPFHVPLLVRTGRYLFENGQLTEARAYLGRAEEIAPQDPTLQSVRAYVARKLAENPDLYRKD